MTDEFKKILGSAIDAVAKTMRPGDGPIPLHCIEAIVGCVIQECALIAGEMANDWSSEWRKGLKCSSHLEGMSDGADDVHGRLLVISGAVKVIDVD